MYFYRRRVLQGITRNYKYDNDALLVIMMIMILTIAPNSITVQQTSSSPNKDGFDNHVWMRTAVVLKQVLIANEQR